jgi:2-haloacid dehalogenase
MEKLSGIRACVFDAYGTLFDVAAPVAKLAGEIGPHAEDISKLWRQKQLEYSWLRSLMGVHVDFWHVTGDALDYALDQFGVSEPGLRDELLALYLKLNAYPEVADALAAVKARSKLTAILSNGSPSMLDASNTWDSHGAAQFGFQVVRVDRFGWKDDRLPGKPAALVKDLSELAGII